MIGNLLEGAVNVKDTVVVLVTVAVPTVGAVGTALAPDPLLPKIGTLSPCCYSLILCGDKFYFM